MTTKTFDGESFDFEIYPQDGNAGDILFVHHGNSRNLYSSGSEDIADREDLSVFSPIFPRSEYDSDAYQRGGIVNDDDQVLPAGEWTTRFEEPMVDWARGEVEGSGDVYLFGHSAGGQYLSRVAAYERPEEVDRFVIANPSTWVLPTLEEDAPYGFDGLGTEAEQKQALKEYLSLPVTVYLGSEDDNSGDPSLSTSSAAMRQGDNRLERGLNAFEMGEDVAAANGWNFNWDLVIAEGVDHSGSSMLRAPEMSQALNPAPEAALDSAPELEPKPESEPEPEATSEPDPTPEPEPESEPTPAPAPGSEPEAEAEPEPEATSEPDPTPEPEPESEPTPAPAPEPAPQPESTSEPEPEAEPEPQPNPEPTSEADQASEPETEPTSEPTPEPEAVDEAENVTFERSDGAGWHDFDFAGMIDDLIDTGFRRDASASSDGQDTRDAGGWASFGEMFRDDAGRFGREEQSRDWDTWHTTEDAGLTGLGSDLSHGDSLFG